MSLNYLINFVISLNAEFKDFEGVRHQNIATGKVDESLHEEPSHNQMRRFSYIKFNLKLTKTSFMITTHSIAQAKRVDALSDLFDVTASLNLHQWMRW